MDKREKKSTFSMNVRSYKVENGMDWKYSVSREYCEHVE